MTSIYDQICAIAETHKPAGYLGRYTDDLYKHDKRVLATAPADGRYLWILRSCGTALFPIAVGHDSIWATYWWNQGNTREAPSLVYLIDVARDSVKLVTYPTAERLARLPSPDDTKYKVNLFGANPPGMPAPY